MVSFEKGQEKCCGYAITFLEANKLAERGIMLH
jgi:hypothetical protein